MKKIILNILYIFFCSLILTLAVRGIKGNPEKDTINEDKWTVNGPFELSPERGRFALTFTIIEDRSVYFSFPIAKFSLPDLGYKDEKYVSLFAPGVSFISIPGYLIGKSLGVSQVGTYFTIVFFALMNVILLRLIAVKLGAGNLPAAIASLLFLFATPAFAYSVSFFQHHISTFLILFTIYTLLKSKSWGGLFLVWFLFALGISVDYPNSFLMLPVIIYGLVEVFKKEVNEQEIKISLPLGKALALVGIIPPIIFFLWFNKTSYGSPFQLAGTVESISQIGTNGKPAENSNVDFNKKEFQQKETKEKTALGFFNTRNLINGLYTHLVSPDRGIIYFAPVVLFGILGFSELRKRRSSEFSLLLSVVGVNLLLYSMWGDPWGGWSFGSRYLIPTYAMMSIFVALGIGVIRKKTFLAFLFGLVLVFSVSVNTLGAITSSANPPIPEVKYLESQSGQIEKYTLERNWEFLFNRGSKSFVYNEFASKYMTALKYYLLITGAIISVLSVPTFYLFLSKKEE